MLKYFLVLFALLVAALWYSSAATAQVPAWQNVSPPGVSVDFNNPPNNYGFQSIAVDPTHPGTVYVGTNYQGIRKSIDYGNTWVRIDQPFQGPCGNNGFNEGRNWAMAVDQQGSVYSVNGYGCTAGLFKSVNGGVNWSQILPFPGPIIDVNRLAVDPYLPGHLLVSAHSNHNCPDVCDTPVGESFNYGLTWQYTAPIPGSGWGQWVFFLNNSSTWLVEAQDHGYFRTTNSGASWTKVSNFAPTHGNAELIKVGAAWYSGANDGVLRSTDDGQTWSLVWNDGTADGIYTVAADPTGRLYTRSSNTGNPTTGPLPMKTSADGLTWTNYSSQLFNNGPMSCDKDAQYIYCSLWLAGVWRLPISGSPPPTAVPATATVVPPSATATPVLPTPTPVAVPCYEAYFQGNVLKQGNARPCP